jgi:predicted RNA binding protein YcfA (HicA-like mRNA interferase family)
LLSFPKDFTYTELKAVLSSFGYNEVQGAGSRVYFSKEGHKIKLHRPHPGNILKRYLLDLIVNELKKKELLSNG